MATSRTTRDQGIARVKRRIIPVSEATPFAKVLLYGRHGKGKTRIAASGPDTLVLDVNEVGTRSVQSYPNCYVYQIKRWEEFVWAYWFLREGKHEFKSVAVDSLTQVQKIAMRHVLNEAEDRDPNRPPDTPERRNWLQMTETVRPFIYDYRNLPMNVVFVCQERIDRGSDDEDESGEIRARYVPDLSPGLRGDAMAAVEILGRVYRRPRRIGKGRKEKVVWETRMLVGDHEEYETKDRTNQLGYVVRNPTMQMMIEASAYIETEEEE